MPFVFPCMATDAPISVSPFKESFIKPLTVNLFCALIKKGVNKKNKNNNLYFMVTIAEAENEVPLFCLDSVFYFSAFGMVSPQVGIQYLYRVTDPAAFFILAKCHWAALPVHFRPFVINGHEERGIQYI